MAEEMIARESTQASTPEGAQNSAEREPRFTQEEVNKIVSKRLAEDRARMDRRDTAVLEEREKAIAAKYEAQITELTERARKAEINAIRSSIAHEIGLPPEIAERLRGETEEDMRKDAAALARFVVPRSGTAAPLASTEPISLTPPFAKAFSSGKHSTRSYYKNYE